MTHNKKIVLASIVVIVAAGLLALNPSILGNVQAQLYANDYGYDSNYNSYHLDPKSSHTDVQKIECINSNINVNGIDITEIPQDDTAAAAVNDGGSAANVANTQNVNGLTDRINFEKNLVNICINVNDNQQVKAPPTCEDCFTQNLDVEDLENLFPIPLEGGPIEDLEELCDLLERLSSQNEKKLAYVIVTFALDRTTSIDSTEREAVIECLVSLGLIEPLTCEDYFSPLGEDQMTSLISIAQVTSIGAYCDRLTTTPNTCQETSDVLNELSQVTDIGQGQFDAIVNCLVDIGVIIPPTQCV